MKTRYDYIKRTLARSREAAVAGCIALLLSVPLITGCGGGLRTAEPVDPAAAIEALKATLETWKSGGTVDDLRQRVPEIVAQDMSWISGARLLDYALLGEPQAVDANLYCSVRLRLSEANGKPTEKSVVYIVGTDPVLTVFRQMP